MLFYVTMMMMIAVGVTYGAVVRHMDQHMAEHMTWNDFEEKNPEILPVPSSTTKPEEDDDWTTESNTEEPPSSDEIGLRTIIAIEFDKDMFESVFIRGGYTGSSAFNCAGAASENPCSIPIRHRIPEGESSNYTEWAQGDKYLDMMGAEQNQGRAGEKEAGGTPMRKMESWAALSRCNSDTSGKQTKTTRDRNKSTFWLVELDMDCAETYGFFEIKVVGKVKSMDRFWYEREIDGKTASNRAVDESCVGGIGGDIPYIAESHIGFCGSANIFYYKKNFCEVNKIID